MGSSKGLEKALVECSKLLMKQDQVLPTFLASGPLKFVEPARNDWEFSRNYIFPLHGNVWFTGGSKTVTGAEANG